LSSQQTYSNQHRNQASLFDSVLLESCANLKAGHTGSIALGSNIRGPKFSITEEPESAEKTNIIDREFGRE